MQNNNQPPPIFTINVSSSSFEIGLLQKVLFIFQKYQFWGYSKWLQNKQSSRLEKRYAIKFLLADKCKPCEIYWRLYMYREACFSQKNVNKSAKPFTIMSLSQKTAKEKVAGTADSVL